MASVGQAPKMETLFTALHEDGFAAARVPDIDPFFVTDAPLEQVLETVRGLV
jgi:tRNA G26 N,N-dimethylase Trm1